MHVHAPPARGVSGTTDAGRVNGLVCCANQPQVLLNGSSLFTGKWHQEKGGAKDKVNGPAAADAVCTPGKGKDRTGYACGEGGIIILPRAQFYALSLVTLVSHRQTQADSVTPKRLSHSSHK